MPVDKPLLIVLGGATASGKTALSVNIAKQTGAEIINADSRQMYDGMQLGTARPDTSEMQGIPHHLFGILKPDTDYTAGRYEKDALNTLQDIFSRTSFAIAVGGSGLYLKALTEGTDELPHNPEIRKRLNERFKNFGLKPLVDELHEKDPLVVATMDIKNPVRVIRALEIVLIAGCPVSELRKNKSVARPFSILCFRTNVARRELYNKIEQRVDYMVNNGLVEEVRTLLPYRNFNSLNTVGYKEIFEYLDGSLSLENAIENIKRNTRNYAKRQETWFKNQGRYIPVAPDNLNLIVEEIKKASI